MSVEIEKCCREFDKLNDPMEWNRVDALIRVFVPEFLTATGHADDARILAAMPRLSSRADLALARGILERVRSRVGSQGFDLAWRGLIYLDTARVALS